MAQHFDIILMDLQMPILNGYEACLKIKKAKSDQGHVQLVPFVVAMSSFVDSSVEQRCLKAKIDLCTMTPLDLSWFKNEVILKNLKQY